jgi:hypothetical protein
LLPLSIARRFLWGAAAALFATLLASVVAIDRIPVLLDGLLIALAVGSGWRPRAGLTAVAVLVPVASWIGRQWNDSVAWPEVVAVAYLAGYSARQAIDRRPDGVQPLSLAIYAMIAVVAASVGVQLLVLRDTIGGGALAASLRDLVGGEYFIGAPFAGLDAAMRLAEGLLLAHAGAFVVRNERTAGRRLIIAVVIGASAAAALNLWRIWLGALRVDSPFISFLHLLVTLRFNTHYGDLNAAGSYFFMAWLPALALMFRESFWRWTPAALLIAVSLMLSGSRAAFLAGMVAILASWWLARRAGQARWPTRNEGVAALTAAVVLVVCAGAAYIALQRNETPALTAVRVRVEFVRTGLNMLATRPLFGVGVGEFPSRLSEFMTPELMAIYPVPQENAHNNFLQVLSETGCVGLAAFLLVLGLAMRSALVLTQEGGRRSLERAVFAGILAFVLTWFSGHPLLVDAPALSFWLMLGVAVGWGDALRRQRSEPAEPSIRASSKSVRWIAAGVALAAAVSIPLRAQRDRADANLEHIGVGVSALWYPEEDGIRYRLAGARSTVFVPSHASAVEVPVRAAQGRGTLRVELYLAGRPADVVTVREDAWTDLVLRIPQHGGRNRFLALELRVAGQDASGELLKIGKAQPRGL